MITTTEQAEYIHNVLIWLGNALIYESEGN